MQHLALIVLTQVWSISLLIKLVYHSVVLFRYFYIEMVGHSVGEYTKRGPVFVLWDKTRDSLLWGDGAKHK